MEASALGGMNINEKCSDSCVWVISLLISEGQTMEKGHHKPGLIKACLREVTVSN